MYKAKDLKSDNAVQIKTFLNLFLNQIKHVAILTECHFKIANNFSKSKNDETRGKISVS